MTEEESMGAFLRKNFKTGGEKVQPAKSMNNTRSVYDVALQNASKKGNPAPTLGYLRLEQSINKSVQNIKFAVLDNVGTPTATERRLKLADSFMILQFGLFIGRVPMAGAAPTADEYSKQVKYTYPEAKVFTKAGEAANLMNIYNGYTELRVGPDTIIDSFPNYKFYRVPESQQGMQYAATAAGVTIQTGGWSNPDWGFLSLVPSVELQGSQTIFLNVNMPTSIDMSAAAGSFNNLIFEMYGFLTQNGAQYNTGRK